MESFCGCPRVMITYRCGHRHIAVHHNLEAENSSFTVSTQVVYEGEMILEMGLEANYCCETCIRYHEHPDQFFREINTSDPDNEYTYRCALSRDTFIDFEELAIMRQAKDKMIASVVKDWEEFPEIRGTQIELSPDDLHWLENNFASLQLCIKLDNVRKGSELDMLIYIGQTLDFNSTLAACKRRLAGQENHPVRAGTINDGPPLPPLLTPVSSSQIPEDFKCAICRTDIGPEANGIPVKTPCNHFTHHDCISRWVNNFSATCPLCRAAFSTENYTLPEVVEVEIEYQAVPWLRGLMDTYLGLEKVNNTV